MGWLVWGKGKRRKVRRLRRVQTAAERLSSCLTARAYLLRCSLVRGSIIDTDTLGGFQSIHKSLIFHVRFSSLT
jgi:hypothetical protein